MGSVRWTVYKHFLYYKRRILRHGCVGHASSSDLVIPITCFIWHTLVHMKCQPLFLRISTPGSL